MCNKGNDTITDKSDKLGYWLHQLQICWLYMSCYCSWILNIIRMRNDQHTVATMDVILLGKRHLHKIYEQKSRLKGNSNLPKKVIW